MPRNPTIPVFPRRPPCGLCLPCRLVRVRDGDTVEVAFPNSERVYALRLLDCWAPETRGKERLRGLESKAAARRLLDGAKRLSVFIPAPKTGHLLDVLTFDRIVAVVYLDSRRTLNAEMVRTGYATKDKAK